MQYSFASKLDRAKALDFIASHLKGYLLYEILGREKILNECKDVKAFCSKGMSSPPDFNYGWGAARWEAETWLISEIQDYLLGNVQNLVVIEDCCRNPLDPRIDEGAAGPFWIFQNQLLWPIFPSMANPHLIEKAIKWALIGRTEIIAFSRQSSLVPESGDITRLSDNTLNQIAGGITRLVTDIFDGEGYMEWTRND